MGRPGAGERWGVAGIQTSEGGSTKTAKRDKTYFNMAISYNEIRARLALFSDKWAEACDEDAEAKSFWDDLFNCYGTNRRQVAKYEVPIAKLDGNKGFIDVLWKGKLIVEHKSRGKDLKAAKVQAEDYMERLKPAERPRFLVTCDFHRFQVYDLHTGHEEHFTLGELPEKAETLGFLGGYEPKRPCHEAPVNIEAVERLGKLYDSMKAGGYPDHDLQAFLVRVLFCLFAEDTGIFEPDSFTDIILDRTSEDGSDLGIRLAQVFETLDAEKGRRQKALDESIAGLPYVNGRLFAGHLALAATDSKMRSALIACTEFDWAKISPAIFGSLFQGVMEAAERRAAGAHYTGEENILKVIKPLFLDALRAEFAAIKTGPQRGREQKQEAFHEKLSKLKFFDPACGCGNFLIITYRELRRLEIEVLKELHPSGQGILDVSLLSKLDVDQFSGIEIDEFPAQIARVALWLIDHVMNVELGYAFGQAITRLPLTKSANIVHGNALRVDWKTVISPEECSYVLGNPPFVGHHYQSPEQKQDQSSVLSEIQGNGVLDFVTNWYVSASQFIQGTRIPVAFVSTNSITQGEQAGLLWNHLFHRYGIKILFAHRTFAWESEARGRAHVHVVIIGFGAFDSPNKTIYDYETVTSTPTTIAVANISPYLVSGPNTALSNKSDPICQVAPMRWGSKATDGGHFVFTTEEKAAFLAKEPASEKWFRPYYCAEDFIHGEGRWCLWLQNIDPNELKLLPETKNRVEQVRAFRAKSKAEATRKYAQYPTLFRQIAQPDSDYLLIPRVSSERRTYIPIGFVSRDAIAGDVQIVANASHFDFGVLTSEIHMAWVRVVCGRLESRLRYGKDIVYNNFPWPAPTTEQRTKVEFFAKAVLDARAAYLPPAGKCNLSDLYDPNTMPPDLAKAHASLDRAVEKCYRAQPFLNDRERVEFLFHLYEQITVPLATTAKPAKKKFKTNERGYLVAR